MAVQIYPSFEYCVTMDGYQFQVSREIDICSHVSCVDDLSSVFITMNSFHSCKVILCTEFSEVVTRNIGKFLGTDGKKLLYGMKTLW